MDIARLIRDIPDFPKPGIVFKDLTPVLADGDALSWIVDEFVKRYRDKVDVIVGIESRGFLLGAPLAYALGKGHVVVRKPGKLPYDTHSVEYELEYGTDSLEIHVDALGRDSRVLIVDDLLATGGTAKAAIELVEKLGAEVVECAFLVELAFLNGRSRLENNDAHALVVYD